MRITYLSRSTLPSEFANSVHVISMCSALGKICNKVTLHASIKPGSDREEIARFYGKPIDFELKCVRRYNIPFFGNLIYGLISALLVSKKHTDIVYARCPHSAFFALMKKIPIIYEVHNIPTSRARWLLERVLFRSSYVILTVAITESLRRDYAKLYSTEGSIKMLVAPDGAELPDNSDAATYSQVNESSSTLVLGYVGSFWPGKGIEIVRELAGRLQDIEFRLIGGDPDMIQRLRSVRERNVSYEERVPHAHVAALMRQCDVLLLPAKRRVEVKGGGDVAKYTSPLKLFEYMGSGRPIISSDLPVLREVLDSGRNCLLANPDNIGEWVDCVNQLRNGEQRTRLADAALNDLRNKYTWDHRAARIIRAIDE